MDIEQFVKRHNITISCELVDQNPNAPDWTNANHFKVTLHFGRRTLTTYFSQGYGISSEPDAAAVLDCLASDSSGVEGADFDEWCREYGYDTDSRKAERIYTACQRQARKLRQFLGDQLYQKLLWDTERL